MCLYVFLFSLLSLGTLRERRKKKKPKTTCQADELEREGLGTANIFPQFYCCMLTFLCWLQTLLNISQILMPFFLLPSCIFSCWSVPLIFSYLCPPPFATLINNIHHKTKRKWNFFKQNMVLTQCLPTMSVLLACVSNYFSIVFCLAYLCYMLFGAGTA